VQGDRVVLMVMADGVTSRTYVPGQAMSRKEELDIHRKEIKRRGQEAYRSAMTLGLKKEDVRLMALADQRLDTYAFLDIVKYIEGIKKEMQPSIVYTHFWNDLNLDHQIVCRATLTAFRPKSGAVNADVFHFEVPESTYLSVPEGKNAFVPNYYVDVSKDFALKLKALDIYESERREYPDFRSHRFIENLGKQRGRESKMKFAEAFVRLGSA